MFLTECPTCGLRELRGVRSIELLLNTGSGPEVVTRCRRCDSTVVLATPRHAATVLPRVAA